MLESRDEQVWIYVNDPPRFLTQPLGTEFVAGGTFQYEPIVRDRNKDAWKAQIQSFAQPQSRRRREVGSERRRYSKKKI